MDVSLTTEVMAIFVIFWSILAKIWLPWLGIGPYSICLVFPHFPQKSPPTAGSARKPNFTHQNYKFPNFAL